MRNNQRTVNHCPASFVTAVLAVVVFYNPSSAFAAPDAGPKAATQENHKVMEIVSKGLDQAFNKSVNRDLEIGKKLQEIMKEQVAMLEALHLSANSEKPFKDQVTPAQFDAFNILNAQLMYYKKAAYLEVLKRRQLRGLMLMVQFFQIEEDTAEKNMLEGNLDAIAINAETTQKIRTAFGPTLGEAGNKASDTLDAAFQLNSARTIPLEGLVGRIKESKAGFGGPWTDELSFWYNDGFPNTPAAGLFIDRLKVELSKGNPAAIEVAGYLDSICHFTTPTTSKK